MLQELKMINIHHVIWWWCTYPSEKYEFVSWDDDIPNIWKVIKAMFQTTNQIYNHHIQSYSHCCWFKNPMKTSINHHIFHQILTTNHVMIWVQDLEISSAP